MNESDISDVRRQIFCFLPVGIFNFGMFNLNDWFLKLNYLAPLAAGYSY